MECHGAVMQGSFTPLLVYASHDSRYIYCNKAWPSAPVEHSHSIILFQNHQVNRAKHETVDKSLTKPSIAESHHGRIQDRGRHPRALPLRCARRGRLGA